MAYKDSDEIATNSNYALGDYSFRIERTSVPGSTNDQLTAICRYGSKTARKSIQIPSLAQLSGWYVEANETVATVYASYSVPEPYIDPIYRGFSVVSGFTYTERWQDMEFERSVTLRPPAAFWHIGRAATDVSFGYLEASSSQPGYNLSYTYAGKTCYYVAGTTSSGMTSLVSVMPAPSPPDNANWYAIPVDKIAWIMVYGGGDTGNGEVIVGRFAIDLEDAGGTGPGSDWIDPGDYDPDWEPEDPTHTLYVEVTGALSGRHNDPIEDPSYSYIPSDKDTMKDYGCGGDGGHGGGGGAGASTVVVHKFATNQANSKEVTAIARRHGYGSGGGKGGKGGDGCILIYY